MSLHTVPLEVVKVNLSQWLMYSPYHAIILIGAMVVATFFAPIVGMMVVIFFVLELLSPVIGFLVVLFSVILVVYLFLLGVCALYRSVYPRRQTFMQWVHRCIFGA